MITYIVYALKHTHIRRHKCATYFSDPKKLNQIINDSVSVPSLIWQRGAVPVITLYVHFFARQRQNKSDLRALCKYRK